MPIKPEDVNGSNLPTAFRGYERQATDELLLRVAWDYKQATRSQGEWEKNERRLKERVAALEEQLASQQSALASQQEELASRQDELARSQAEELDRHDLEAAERTAALETEVKRLQEVVRGFEQRDELTRTLLSNAQRSAREMRESTRTECEALLKAAHRRAAEIEAGAHSSARSSEREIERLRKLELSMKAELRRTLESVIGDAEPQPEPEPEREHEPSEQVPTTAVD